MNLIVPVIEVILLKTISREIKTFITKELKDMTA